MALLSRCRFLSQPYLFSSAVNGDRTVVLSSPVWRASHKRSGLGAELIGVSPDTGEESEDLRQRLGLSITILSDTDLSVTDSYGLRHPGGRAATGEDKPFPTTFIVDRAGIVRAKLENESHRVRPDPQAVLFAIRDVVAASQ